MRVIAGSARGLRLKTLKEPDVRPTSDRIRESIFGILGAQVMDSQFLDLYAGIGSVGIEALSRGARMAVFVDRDPRCISAILTNLDVTHLRERAEVYRNEVSDAVRILKKRGYGFDIVFLDPPYASRLAGETVMMLDKSGLVRGGGLVVAEHSRREEMPQELVTLEGVRLVVYGDTTVSFYRVRNSR